MNATEPEQVMKLAIVAELAKSGIRLGTDIVALFDLQEVLENLLVNKDIRERHSREFRDFLVSNKNRVDKQIIALLAKSS